MSSELRSRKFLNYPEPLKGPDVPYRNERKPVPGVRGIVLVAAAFLMEWLSFLREAVWRNAGFGSLRKIIEHLEDYEPWFEPQVVRLPEATGDEDKEADESSQPHPVEELMPSPHGIYPQAKYYSVAEYHKLYLSGALTPLEVVEALLPLIRRDLPQPNEHSKAWFETNIGKVLRAASESTQRYKENRSLGPLDGVPTGVKDEYDMEGYRTCLGSKNTYTSPDEGAGTAWCVRKLEAAGAIILGKLSMHEFGLDTTGNNPLYGTPLNPYNPNYYTGGSSSGTGYAVSAGLIPVGLGSDGGGSIRIPSSLCGVFGLKPTHGRLSFKPGQNHCLTCACLGPIAADVASLAALFQVVAEPHPTSPFPNLGRMRLTAPSAGEPKILGIPTDWISQATPAIQTLCYGMVRQLVQDHGYTTVKIDIPLLPEGQTAHALTVLTDAATLLPDTRGLTAANRILLALGRVTPATDYMLAQKLRRVLMQHLAWLWAQHPGMLIVTPTTACEGWPIRGGSAELKHGVNDGHRTMQSMEYVWLANFCGLPSISLPAGFVPAELGSAPIPIGLMATGEWCAEEQLLRFGLLAEQLGAEHRRRPPNWVDVVQLAKETRRA
ncbi:amidase signature domain-containing protein [Lasiosphaeria ovina]|uniref:Amidase signature domain-containing protein n=1 Tax=Lasiosphaeria ovina TaxID=92902 RepID=A0AAE0TYB6_9PEZI|nr:amidase signature domain-containing protein [Lasiosphaeria ovina]